MAWLAEAGEGAEPLAGAAPGELQGSRALLLARPTGVYTCARLVAGRAPALASLVAWRFHLERLATGLRSVDAAVSSEAVDELQTRTNRMVERVAEVADRSGDLMVTALWWEKSGSGERVVSVHACSMPQPKLQGASAFVCGDARKNARCKHSKWVVDRAPIEKRARRVEKELGSTFQEVLLSAEGQDGDRLLLEGSVSNFFVVRDGCVVTAEDDVLHGSTRELVLAACKDLEIPVVFEPPRLSERDNWTAAFVTSAVRIVMEITTLFWEEMGSSTTEFRKLELPSTGSGIPRRIRDHILAQRMYLSATKQ